MLFSGISNATAKFVVTAVSPLRNLVHSPPPLQLDPHINALYGPHLTTPISNIYPCQVQGGQANGDVRDDIEERIRCSQRSHEDDDQQLDGETLDFLVGMWRKGDLIDGPEGFGSGLGGINNGIFCGYLKTANAPPYTAGRRDDDKASFLSKGDLRQDYSTRVLRACMKAHFPVVFEGDCPSGSVMAAACRGGLDINIKRLGNLGNRVGTQMYDLSSDFMQKWTEGHVGDKLQDQAFCGKSTWTIQNFEVSLALRRVVCSRRVLCLLLFYLLLVDIPSLDDVSGKMLANTRADRSPRYDSHLTERCRILSVDQEDDMVDSTSYNSIKCREASELVRNTRMGGLCHSKRQDARGGTLTGEMNVDGKAWSGSEVTAFAMTSRGVTKPHFDGQMVHGEFFLLPAAGTMRSVNRRDKGSAKRAVVTCAHDMDKVVSELKLGITKTASTQYNGGIENLESLASLLTEKGIRFVVINFPEHCSYAIPEKCGRMFVTERLVESSAWHPVFNF